MTTLNARANQAWHEATDGGTDPAFDRQQDAFEEAWETGYKTAAEEIARALEAIPDKVYPADVFLPDSTSVDAHSARVMRVAYPAAANIAREIGGVS